MAANIEAELSGLVSDKNIAKLSTGTFPLILLTVVVALFGFAAVLFSQGSNHWMEGPAIAILVVFMPLTAISYLHFRLPKKHEEFKAIKKMLHNENATIESFSVNFNRYDSSMDYLLPVTFVSLFSVLGFYILLSNNAAVLFNGMEWVAAGAKGVANNVDWSTHFDTQKHRSSVIAIGMSFLGAYIWSVQYIFRRMMTLDLPPGAYYSVGGRIVYSVFIAVVIQHFILGNTETTEQVLTSQLIAISFLVGIFPERALAWMKDSLGNIFTRKTLSTTQMPLELLEGVSSFHKARLSELGIDNLQNLAQASLLELILKTPFPPRVIADWMAQSRLCLEFKEEVVKIRKAGVRTILDLLEVGTDEELLKALSINSGVELSLIKTVCHANKDEISIKRLRDAYDSLNMI